MKEANAKHEDCGPADSDALEQLSTRELQAYGALCLFCRAKHISHPALDHLLDHLLSLLVTENLSQWETTGAQLELSNRGFDLPEEITSTNTITSTTTRTYEAGATRIAPLTG